MTFISVFLSFLLSRDAIAKALYSVLFDWLVEQINEWLSPTEMDSTVGIVDIYGFEVSVQFGLWSGNVQVIKHILVQINSQWSCDLMQNLGVNSFEQLCINFANEHLQHFVNKAVITQEQVSVLYTAHELSTIRVTHYKRVLHILNKLFRNIIIICYNLIKLLNYYKRKKEKENPQSLVDISQDLLNAST